MRNDAQGTASLPALPHFYLIYACTGPRYPQSESTQELHSTTKCPKGSSGATRAIGPSTLHVPRISSLRTIPQKSVCFSLH